MSKQIAEVEFLGHPQGPSGEGGSRQAAPEQLQRVRPERDAEHHRRDRGDRDRDCQHTLQDQVRQADPRHAEGRRDRRLGQQHPPHGGQAQEPHLLVAHHAGNDHRGGGAPPRHHPPAHRRPPGHGEVGALPSRRTRPRSSSSTSARTRTTQEATSSSTAPRGSSSASRTSPRTRSSSTRRRSRAP